MARAIFWASALFVLSGFAGQASQDFVLPAARAHADVSETSATTECSVWLGGRWVKFDLANRLDLQRLAQGVSTELEHFKLDDDSADPPGVEKRVRRGLVQIQRLTQGLLNCTEAVQIHALQQPLLETAAAANNLRRAPVPERIDFFQVPAAFLERLSRPVGQGHTLATDLEPGDLADPSRLDPEPSTFWHRPQTISDQDLYHGFGRTHLLLESEPLCSYAGPKESFGRNPGFQIECDGVKLKLKFAEVSSEPFAARIFDALGYHTDPTDYAPRVKMRYSRTMFQEFNSRKPLRTHFTFLGIVSLYTLDLQQHYDPFDYVSSAVLADGTRWSGRTLKHHLLRNPDLPRAELDSSNYRGEVEASIDYLETVAANVQRKIGKTIGPWDFGELDHSSRRELRGAGLLAAWLGWFDTRFDNTRLRIVKRDGKHEMEHYFSDLGGVLGETSGILYSRGELPNAFPWTFTRPPLRQGEHQLAKPLRLSGYKPLASTPAFAEMTIDDARWMARLLGSLTSEQIEQALIASGFDSAQVRLYLAKLLCRRDQMMVDLGLVGEMPATEARTDRDFSYNPITEGPQSAKVHGTVIEAPLGDHQIVGGKLFANGARIGSVSPKRASTK
jgi:hypothetical protein